MLKIICGDFKGKIKPKATFANENCF